MTRDALQHLSPPEPEYFQVTSEELEDMHSWTHIEFEQQSIKLHQRIRSRPVQPQHPDALATLLERIKNVNFNCYCPYSEVNEACDNFSFEACIICTVEHEIATIRQKQQEAHP